MIPKVNFPTGLFIFLFVYLAIFFMVVTFRCHMKTNKICVATDYVTVAGLIIWCVLAGIVLIYYILKIVR